MKIILTVIVGIVLALGSMILPGYCFAQPNQQQFEQIEKLQFLQKRNTIVFIYTEWCKYCKSMEHITFKNKGVIKIVNDAFYFVKLNGEEKRAISFRGKTYSYKPIGFSNGTHELAAALGMVNGNMDYPVLVALNPENEIIARYQGYLSYKNLIDFLTAISMSEHSAIKK